MAIAFARLLRVAIMHRVTDSYGPIPYSKLESNESVYVEYDSQEAVYTKMFEELDEAQRIPVQRALPIRIFEADLHARNAQPDVAHLSDAH